MKLLFKIKSALLLTSLFVFTSCGGDAPMVSEVKVTAESQSSELFVTMDATLNLGNVLLSDLTLPVIVQGDQVGDISLYTNLEGKNKFEVSINLTSIVNIETAVAELPNGNPLPLIRDNKTIAIRVQDKATLYLTYSEGVVAMGASINIRGLDSVGASVGTTSVFPMFNQNNIIGAAGIYTSPEAGKNGFAIVANVSSVIDSSLLSGGSRGLRSAASVDFNKAPVELDYRSIKPSKRKNRRLNRKLYKLHKRKAVL